MTQVSSTGNGQSTTELTDSDWYHLLSAQERRRVLDILSNRSEPILVTDLATQVAAADSGQPLVNISTEETKEVQTTLRHTHLPKLEEAGLVTEVDGTVTTTRRMDHQNPRIEAILATEAHGLDAVLDCLANERQRTILRILSKHGGPMDRSTLAAKVAETIGNDKHADVRPEKIEVELHHRYILLY